MFSPQLKHHAAFFAPNAVCVRLKTRLLGFTMRTRSQSKSCSSPELAPKRRRTLSPHASSPQHDQASQTTASDSNVALKILSAEKKMSIELGKLVFSSPVTHVYNPLDYAWEAHEWFVNTFGNSERKVLLIGMNPGPWGMAQTGVPFGEVNTVRDWMKMPADTHIARPSPEHDKRPVLGLSTPRTEVSGRRLWQEWAQGVYDTPENFFQNFFVHNYCPLMFLESTGRNRTPVQIRAKEREPLLNICDEALRSVIVALNPQFVCGIGAFAAARCKAALNSTDLDVRVGTLLHPSPASPTANRGWLSQFTTQLNELTEQH